jgi:hypothetical protein
MLDIQLKNITAWATLLEKWGAQYKIILPDGQEFGALEVAPPPKARKRVAGPYPYGTLQAYFKPMLAPLGAGDVVTIPCGEFEPDRLRSAISAWGAVHWGKGNCNTYANKETHAIEVMRAN